MEYLNHTITNNNNKIRNHTKYKEITTMNRLSPFMDFINEDKSRFVKKNRNLNRYQQDDFIDWLRDHTHAETKYLRKNKNNPKVFTNMTWDEAQSLMATETKTSKKKAAKALRHKGISGLKEKDDYIHVKTRNKMFLVYIPLHAEAAKVIMSVHIGDCWHEGCIGSSNAEFHYSEESIKTGKVPVIVIGNGAKYAVMIDRSNSSWDIWYRKNFVHDVRHDEGIPNFSIKKELLTSKLKDLYDDIRENTWMRGAGKEAAIKAYNDLAYNIEYYVKEYSEAMKYGEDEMKKNLDNTITKYRDAINDKWAEYYNDKRESDFDLDTTPRDEIDRHLAIQNRIDNIRSALKGTPMGTGTNSKGEPIWHISGMENHTKRRGRNKQDGAIKQAARQGDVIGVEYTKDELKRYLDFAEKNYKKKLPKVPATNVGLVERKKKEVLEFEKETNKMITRLQAFKKQDEIWKMHGDQRDGEEWLDDVDWFDSNIPNYDDEWADNVYSPDLEADEYRPYFDFNESFDGDRLEDSYLDDRIREIASEGHEDVDGNDFLTQQGFKHPEKILAENS